MANLPDGFEILVLYFVFLQKVARKIKKLLVWKPRGKNFTRVVFGTTWRRISATQHTAREGHMLYPYHMHVFTEKLLFGL